MTLPVGRRVLEQLDAGAVTDSQHRDLVDRGRLRDIDPRIAVDTLITAANGTSSWFHPKDGMSIEAVSQAVLELLIHGITCDEPKSAKSA